MCSGDPYTTLGNTFRTICYLRYYTRSAGPCSCFAAGDDGVVLTDDTSVHGHILSQTSRTPDGVSPLGQIVKEATLSELQGIEFCSKWFYKVSGKLYATRNLVKVLATKQYYSRKNAHLLNNPHLHRLAILQGL